MRPLRLLLFSSTYPPLFFGGPGRISAWLADALGRRGVETTVLTVRGAASSSPPRVLRILSTQGDWEAGRRPGRRAGLQRALGHRLDLFRSLRTLRAVEPDALLVVDTMNAFLAPVAAARMRGIPALWLCEGPDYADFMEEAPGRIDRIVFALTGRPGYRPPVRSDFAAVLGCSRYVLDWITARGFRAPVERILYNSVPPDLFPPRSRVDGGSEAPRILWTGRFVERKGLATAFEALSLLRRRGGSLAAARMTLVGDGTPEDMMRLEAHARRWEVRGAVDLLPFERDERALAAIYRDHDVFWMTALLHEGLSFTLLEAMSSGLPVVATRAGGNPEAVEPSGGGFVVEPGDARAFAEATARLWEDGAERARMGAAAATYVRSRHSIDGMAEALEGTIREVVRRRG